jgi:flagellar biosynthesis protein FlhF
MAFEQIQKELGPEAIIVSVRQIPGGDAWETWKRPEVEVLAIPGAAAPAKAEPKAPPMAETRSKPDVMSHLLASAAQPGRQAINKARLEELLLELAARQGHQSAAVVEAPTPVAHPPRRETPRPLQNIKDRLLRQGLDAELIEKVAQPAAEALSAGALMDETRLTLFVRGQLEAVLRTPQANPTRPNELLTNRIIAVVGASGAGKTSVCAKLASFAVKTLKKKVAWINADTLRTGAIALARAYTEPLEIPLHLAYTPQEVSEAAAVSASADLILVDTPARNPRRPEEIVELGAYLTALPERTTYLAAPANAKEADLLAAVNAFGPFSLKGLVITKLDETGGYGSFFNLAWKSRLPVIYTTSSPRPVGGLQLAQAKKLTGLLFGEALSYE